MFDYNIFDCPEPLRLFLCRPDDTLICELNGIDAASAQVHPLLNGQFELSFDYMRYVDNFSDGLVESNGYHLINVGMYIYLEKIGRFRMKYPPYTHADTETKSITAYSCDCELEDKILSGFKINTGEKDSFEYLVTYDDDEDEQLLNAYTNLPYDYILFCDTRADHLTKYVNKYADGTITNSSAIQDIMDLCSFIPRLKNKVITSADGQTSVIEYVRYNYDSSGKNVQSITLSGFNDRVKRLIPFYQKYRNQLSLIDLVIENGNCNWTVGEIDPDLAIKKFQFSVEDTNIYGFLTQDIATTSKCMARFDIVHRKINIVSLKNIGRDSGIIIDRQNLMNSVEVSCDEDSLVTRYEVSGADGLGLGYVNFGSNKIDDITYFLYARDIYGNKVYVDDALTEKYKQYMADREKAREKYIEVTKEYNQSTKDIYELTYKVPNDYLSTDWSQYTLEELDGLNQTYARLMATLLTLYKEDFGTNGLNSDGSVNEAYMKNTAYWPDYYAYQQIMTQIEEAAVAYSAGGNYGTIDNETALKKINAWKTEWTLYGTVELQSKISSYENSMKALIDSKAIVLKNKNTLEPKTWNEITAQEKKEYGNSETQYKYAEYKELYDNRNGAQAYLNQLKNQVSNLESQKSGFQETRVKLMNLVDLKTYNRDELGKIVTLDSNPNIHEPYFTEEQIRTINLLYRDGTYSNENILTTSLDDIVTTISVQQELLDDAKEQVSIASQPQIKFTSDINNLLSMKEFQKMAEQFVLGDYMYVQYFDDYYVRLRLIGYTFNPCIPSDKLSVEFSNFTKSNVELSDFIYLLGNSGSSDGSGGGSGAGSSAGTLGNNIDLTLSDTMLSKLVNTELFGTAVSNVVLDTMHLNALTAKTATFGGLADGTTKINAKGIETGYIKDKLYNGHEINSLVDGNIQNTKGSIINLETGKFNLGGGSLVFDGTNLTLGPNAILTWGQISGTENVATTSQIPKNVSQLNNDSGYQNASQVTTITKDTVSTSYVNALNVTAQSVQSSWVYAGKIAANQVYSGTLASTDGRTTVLNLNDGTFNFGNGSLSWSNNALTVKGIISAWANSTFGPWVVGDLSIYRGSYDHATQGGMYFGVAGLSVSNQFVVDANGYLTATGANISGTINASGGTIGGWTISDAKIYAGDGTTDAPVSVMQRYIKGQNQFVFAAGGSSHSSYKDCPFRVRYDGTLYAEKIRVKDDLKLYVNTTDETEKYYSALSVAASDVNTLNLGNDFYTITTNADLSTKRSLQVGTNVIIGGDITLFDGHYIYSENNIVLIGRSTANNIWIGDHQSNIEDTREAKGCYISANNIYKRTSGGNTSLSDERFKTDITDIINAEDFIMALSPKLYHFTDGTSNRLHSGFLAGDVKAAMDSTIGDFGVYVRYTFDEKTPIDPENPDTYICGLRYEELIAPHIALTQKHNKQIRELIKEIAKLNDQLNMIKNEIY